MLTNDSELRMAEAFIAQLTQLLTDAGCGDPAETAETRLSRTLDLIAGLQTQYRLRLRISRRLREEAQISWACDDAPRRPHLPRPRCVAAQQITGTRRWAHRV